MLSFSGKERQVESQLLTARSESHPQKFPLCVLGCVIINGDSPDASALERNEHVSASEFLSYYSYWFTN